MGILESIDFETRYTWLQGYVRRVNIVMNFAPVKFFFFKLIFTIKRIGRVTASIVIRYMINTGCNCRVLHVTNITHDNDFRGGSGQEMIGNIFSVLTYFSPLRICFTEIDLLILILILRNGLQVAGSIHKEHLEIFQRNLGTTFHCITRST